MSDWEEALLSEEGEHYWTIKGLRDEITRLKEENKELEEKLKVAEKALEFYSHSPNYSGGCYGTVLNNCEDTAHKALEAIRTRRD